PPDSEMEVADVTYRITGVSTGEVIYHERMKALTAQGRTSVSKIQMTYAASFEDFEFQSLRTIKKDGAVVEGDVTASFDAAEAENPLIPYFSDERTKTILAPNVEVGDSVEFEAVRHIRQWAKPGDFWFEHYLDTEVPTHSTTLVLDLPADRAVAFYESKTFPGKTEIKDGRRIERWTLTDL